MIVVLTPAMTAATKGVFHREIAAALIEQKEMGEYEGEQLRFVIPVKIGDCGLLSSLKAFQAIDVSDVEGVEALTNSIYEDWEKTRREDGAGGGRSMTRSRSHPIHCAGSS